ncbi:adenosylcobinamide-GDP ribazoletransferase [Pedobacter cryoconitis]|uniref:Adenosylcobinamide-GDP ribazoletransferase n=1 Tax=Pedobacter cryoconitis TaxID=188932 RepID=A0A7X0J846_9SPHI|nr:adenosylcobinamide-GDP ribazoletransferase [Pedobacter cryoconitis]MBB6501597.1 adenosylcobinamide-GDP ribazoletransferase [Pedobacter cryoconitis]
MNKQLRLFFTALSFYSRLPAPAFVHQDNAHYLPDSIRYLPVIGWITGLVTACVFIAARWLFGDPVAVLLSMVASVLLTGAFHEDGFADVCDGFGGGWAKEKILDIMKDSRLGTYGVVGLILLLGIKFAALLQLFTETFIDAGTLKVIGLFIVAHSLSRFAAITVVFNHSYARIEESKASGAVAKGKSLNLILAGVFMLIPLVIMAIYLAQPLLFLTIVPVVLFSLYLGEYFKKWIGGYTGDCLGAVQQMTEVIIYLAYILIWKFI